MKQQTADTAEMLIRHQIERMQFEYKNLYKLDSSRISLLMTNLLNLYAELSMLYTKMLIEEVEENVAEKIARRDKAE